MRHYAASMPASISAKFTAPMLGLAKRVKAKILQASTSEVYGDPNVHPQHEEYWGHVNPTGPRSCYDEGKRCAETLFFDYWRQHNLRIKVARIFNTYGPRMHPNDGRVISNFIIQALLDKDLTVYGDGTQTRSFCYVDDLVDGVIKLMPRVTVTTSNRLIAPSTCWKRSPRPAARRRSPSLPRARTSTSPPATICWPR